MKKIILGVSFGLLVCWLFPWRKINWGKISFLPAETVEVTGEAKSVQQNQIASFTAGVDSLKDKKEEAVKEVNDKVSALITAVKDFGIKSEDIKTQNLSVYQNEEMYWDNGVQKSRKGQWRVNNSVEITLRDINLASKLADLLTSSGATNVYGPNFRMDDTNEAEKELFEAAMLDAKDKAEIVAAAAGRKLGKVLTVSETGRSSVYPLMKVDVGMGGGGAPTEPGSTTVYKNLVVVFELK